MNNKRYTSLLNRLSSYTVYCNGLYIIGSININMSIENNHSMNVLNLQFLYT